MKKKKYVSPVGMTFDEYLEKHMSKEEIATLKARAEVMYILDSFKRENGLTQKDIAKKTGVSQPVISRLFNSDVDSKIYTLIDLLNPFGYTIKIVPINLNSK